MAGGLIQIGTDLLKVSRMEEVLERHPERFARRILAESEFLEYSSHPRRGRYMAKRFAAKEAVGKALGTGIGQGVSWQEIVISHDEIGAPLVRLSGRAAEVARRRGGSEVLLSISDEEEYVLAFACLVAGQ